MNDGDYNRTERFQDNTKLNALLEELKRMLQPVQREVAAGVPKFPVGCIIGNPRSGTTILLQWMASLGMFSYPTNFLTRFAYAPYVGALIQRMLFEPEYDFHGDFDDIQSGINFSSDLGKSKGALASNEFQHFFRNHMPNYDLEWLDEEMLSRVDVSGIEKGLASIEQAFGRPFVTKANILQFNLAHFSREIPSLFWIHVTREPLYIMQSILEGRNQYYGDVSAWLSARPKEYARLKAMDVHHQVAGQVYYTEQAIKDGLTKVPEAAKLTVSYEAFCADPGAVYREMADKYAALGCDLPSAYEGPQAFTCGNKIRLPADDIRTLESAYDDFLSGSVKMD